MPRDWLHGDKSSKGRHDDLPTAEWPDADPLGDGSEAPDDLRTTDYRKRDRDTLFDGLKQRLDLVAVMVTVIIAGVVGYVGINIMSDTSETAGLGDYTTDTANNTQWQNTSLDLHNGLESFFSQLGTVFVVIVLVVIIGYLMLLRGR